MNLKQKCKVNHYKDMQDYTIKYIVKIRCAVLFNMGAVFQKENEKNYILYIKCRIVT